MWRRTLLVVGPVVVVVALLAGPASAQVESTTTTTSSVGWTPAASDSRAAACAWEWGGQVETTPARCDDTGEPTLPVWLLVSQGFIVLVLSAQLVAAWRR
jgi:hypothetical protein